MVYIDQIESHNLNSIITSQGIRKAESGRIVETLARWERSYGIAWVVKRLKAMKASLLSGDLTGIKMKNGQFAGPFHAVSLLHASSRRGRIRADRILRVYGRWAAKSPTKADYEALAYRLAPKGYKYTTPTFRVYGTVTFGHGGGFHGVVKTIQGVKPSLKELSQGRCIAEKAQFDLALPISETKKVPFLGRVERFVIPCGHYLVMSDYCPNILATHMDMFENVFELNNFDLFSSDECMFTKVWDNKCDVVGKVVGLTKDRGLKVRYIANPHRFIQLALSRLQGAAASFLKQQPESLVYDQSSAVGWVQTQLREGNKIWSLDLSSATDSFPIGLQLEVIRDLFPALSADIDLFEEVSGCLFENPDGDVSIRWTKGQPMGLGPSFAVFTLTHLLLVRRLGGNEHNFRIIGDDIIITDVNLAESYISAMGVLGVEISKAKSLMAADLAEFAGRIIDKEGIYTSYKASPLDVTRDPLGYYRQYGLSILDLLPESIRRVTLPLVRLGILFPELYHLRDPALLSQVDPVLLLELLSGSGDQPYPVQRTVTQVSSFMHVPTRFEESHLQGGGGFLGSIGSKNEPNIAEHVNINMMEGNLSPFIESLRSTLTLGGSLRQTGEVLSDIEKEISSGERKAELSWEPKHPISFIRKVFKSLNLKDLEGVF